MTDVKRGAGPVNEEGLRSNASKQQKVDLSMSSKERKEKLSEQIAALQQLVSPYGKTDTASVLLEATDYIKFLQEQVKEPGQYSLRSKGLCLIPISYTAGVARNNGADIWAPINSTSPRL